MPTTLGVKMYKVSFSKAQYGWNGNRSKVRHWDIYLNDRKIGKLDKQFRDAREAHPYFFISWEISPYLSGSVADGETTKCGRLFRQCSTRTSLREVKDFCRAYFSDQRNIEEALLSRMYHFIELFYDPSGNTSPSKK